MWEEFMLGLPKLQASTCINSWKITRFHLWIIALTIILIPVLRFMILRFWNIIFPIVKLKGWSWLMMKGFPFPMRNKILSSSKISPNSMSWDTLSSVTMSICLQSWTAVVSHDLRPEANLFSAVILMPDIVLLSNIYYRKDPFGKILSDLVVSTEALAYRLRDLFRYYFKNWLSDNQSGY